MVPGNKMIVLVGLASRQNCDWIFRCLDMEVLHFTSLANGLHFAGIYGSLKQITKYCLNFELGGCTLH